MELNRRQIDGHLHVLVPAHRLAAGGLHHPFSERMDKAGSFRHGNENAGRHIAPHRMFPAQQRLEAAKLAGLRRHLRLVIDFHLVVLQRGLQIGLEGFLLGQLFLHADLENARPAGADSLGLIKRQVGTLEQFIRIDGAVRNGDADAGANFDLLLTQLVSAADLVDELGGKAAGGVLVQIVGDDGEFVAAQTADHVIIAADGRKALRHGLKQRIARIVAERVVHVLEAVEIEEKDGRRSRTAEGSAQSLDQFLAEQRAVRQARQRIVIGIMLEPDIFRLQFQRGGT
ncbi:hypothetical protein D3C78_799730 [compost metagenome]